MTATGTAPRPGRPKHGPRPETGGPARVPHRHGRALAPAAVLGGVHQPAPSGGDRCRLGYLSLPTTLNLDNYVDAWNQAEMARYFLNTLVIVVPAVLLVLFLASMMAFTVSRYSWRFNLIFLLLFTAANLLPPQVIITPLYRIF